MLGETEFTLDIRPTFVDFVGTGPMNVHSSVTRRDGSDLPRHRMPWGQAPRG